MKSLLLNYLVAAGVSIFAGLDRTAAFQIMLARPIVAAPLTGCLLGEPTTGVQIGLLLELLWLGRLPIGAAIPPDDTQVAVGAAALAIGMGEWLNMAGLPFTLLAVCIALPIGKIGQVFERLVRERNLKLLQQAESLVAEGCFPAIERAHLFGLIHFAAASLVTYAVIASTGTFGLYFLAPLLFPPFAESANWLQLLMIFAGTAVIIGTVNVSRAMSLFVSSFAMAFLMLWLL